MDFLKTVKTLFPNFIIRTAQNDTLVNKSDILHLFDANKLGSLGSWAERSDIVPVRVDNPNGTFTLCEYFNKSGVEFMVRYSSSSAAIKIRTEMARLASIRDVFTHENNNIPISALSTNLNDTYGNSTDTIKLTPSILKEWITNIFPNDIFAYDVLFGSDYLTSSTSRSMYHSSMYMPKYNISFELPGITIDPDLRLKFAAKTNTKCIQIQDETTFNGNIVDTMRQFSRAIGIANGIISKTCHINL